MKTLDHLLRQDKERYTVPRRVRDLIPIKRIWNDGIFLTGNRFSMMYRFSDINYLVASREDKETMFRAYSALLNSLDPGTVTKITINNHRMNQSDFERTLLMPLRGGWQTSGIIRICRMAFNLWNDHTKTRDCRAYTPYKLVLL